MAGIALRSMPGGRAIVVAPVKAQIEMMTFSFPAGFRFD